MAQGIFTNTELSSILERARSRREGVEESVPPKSPEPYKFQGSGQLSAAQVAKFLEAHAAFSSQLGRSLSTLLGAECGVTAAAVQQSACGELLKQTPEGALFAALAVPSLDTAIYLHAELATVLPMIDLLLGGAGAASSALRPLTDIEQEIFKPIVDLFAAELKTAWTPLVETSPRYAYHGMAEEVFPSAQRVLGLKFEIRVAEWQGTWNLILPSLLSTALIRKMEQQTGVAESEKSDASERRLRERLLDSRFRLELFLPPTTVSVRSLAHLKVGQVVVLKQPSSDPIDVNIDGVNLFQALPVSCGTRRGAQIKKIFPVAAGVEKEKGSS